MKRVGAVRDAGAGDTNCCPRATLADVGSRPATADRQAGALLAQIDPDDRRFFVWRTQAPPRPPEAYADLVSWLNRGGDGIVLDFLLTRDLAGYSPHARPPATNSRTDLLTASLSPVEQFLRDAFNSGEPPLDRDVTTVRHVQEYLTRQTRYHPSPKEIGRILRALGATELGQKRIGTKKPHLWALRDHDRWKAASEREIGLHMPDAPIPTPMPTRRSARKAP